MRRLLVGGLVGTLVLLGSMALGVTVSSRLAPQRLCDDLERALSEALDSPVSVERLRFERGWGLGLEAENLAFWPGPQGPRLRVDKVRVRIKPLPLILGRVGVSRMIVEGARLRVERDSAGHWRPPFDRAEAHSSGHPEELLAPLIQLEAGLRKLLTGRLFADEFSLRDGQLVLVDTAASAPEADAGGPREIALVGLRIQARRSPWLGSQRVTAQAQLVDGGDSRGTLELESERRRGGEIRIALATTGLDLRILNPSLRGQGRGASLSGSLTGAMAFETSNPGYGELDIDLIAHDLRAVPPGNEARNLAPIEAPRARCQVVLAIDPQQVRIPTARVTSGPLDLRFEGGVERPLRPESLGSLKLAFRDVALDRALDLMAWLPEAKRGTAATLARPVEAGELVALTARGVAPLEGWRSLLVGRAESLPAGLEITGEVRDARIRVGEDDRIEGIAGRITWRGDRIELREGRGRLNGSPLPELELTLDGVSHLLATDPSQRSLHSGAKPLLGMGALWAFFGGGEDADSGEVATTVEIQIDHLEHPMFLWPIDGVRARVEPVEGGVHIAEVVGSWAGASIRADADWLFEPEERVAVRATAAPASQPAAPRTPSDHWAEGRFAVGAFRNGSFHQTAARGRFDAIEAKVRLQSVAIDLGPEARVVASGSLDLERPGVVPFRLDVALRDGDVGVLVRQVGLAPGSATGSLDVSGRFSGRLDRRRFFQDLSGWLELTASDGQIRRAVPPVVALALASASFNPFSGRDAVRYREIRTELEFARGTVRTEAFTLDGPDLRVVAAGELELARSPHALDATVGLFLFRQIDHVLAKIPLLNRLLLGPNDNLVAAYFSLKGPWSEPEARLVPLESFTRGPGSIVFETLPQVVKRGWDALGSVIERIRDRGKASSGPARWRRGW